MQSYKDVLQSFGTSERNKNKMTLKIYALVRKLWVRPFYEIRKLVNMAQTEHYVIITKSCKCQKTKIMGYSF